MSENSIGKKVWVFPDGELPPPGEFELKGHESVIILNMNDRPANIRMTLFFVDREPFDDIRLTVDAQRVRCLRMDNPDDLSGYRLPLETQYAIKLTSDVPVVVQYGRLDTRQANMAFYTTMGFSV
jgi:hypothetical protein